MKRLLAVSIAIALALTALPARADAGNQLIDAAYRGDLAQARDLLAGGAAATFADVHGDTPLHWAAREGHLNVVQLLLAKGAPIDAANRNGETPLMQAASYGRLAVVRALLAGGASLAPRDRDGHTVVDLANMGGMDALIVLVTEAANGVRPDPPTGAMAAGALGPHELLMGLEDRMRNLGPRIDALPFAGTPLVVPRALPMARWTGQKFMFMPMERDDPDEAPSFSLGPDRPTPESRNVAYETLVGRVGTVLRYGEDAGGRFVVMKLDDDGTVLRGTAGPDGNLPELAPALDLFVARKLYTGKILWPKDNAIDRYTRSRGAGARIKLGPGVPVLVRGVFPAENAANPVRLVLETADGRQGFLDMTLSGTNAPTGGNRHVYRFNDLFFSGNPRHTQGWSASAWAAIRAERVLAGFTADQVRAAWGRPARIEVVSDGQIWTYDGPPRIVRIENGRVIEAKRR